MVVNIKWSDDVNNLLELYVISFAVFIITALYDFISYSFIPKGSNWNGFSKLK